MKVGVAGQGAFGVKHLEALANIPGTEVITLAGGNAAATEEVAKKFKIPHWTGDLAESLKQPGLEAMILATPTGMHAKQGEQCMRAGRHVQIEIPIADSLADSERLVKVQKETGVVCMGGHTRRFNPSHQYVHKKIKAGELKIQQMNVQTYFFRRSNMNAAGKPRSWTDHLLWHHACHTVDLFQYQTGELVSDCYAVQGPIHPELKITMDMGIVMKVASGAICTLSLSFNNKGPLGTNFRYICDNGTFLAYYDDLLDGDQNKIDVSKVDVSMNGIELQDREFFAAIKEHREPNASVAQCLTAMQVLDRLEKILNSQARATSRP
jgi:2-hydroxy-4-carboxymuconate semialdehyde hemiacetal dehydrogenase